MAEETGYVLAEADLVGPLATRYAVHGYSDQVLEQQESFYLVRVAAFEVDISAHTEEEQITLQGHRWWSRSEIEAGGAWIWPAQLLELWDRAAEPEPAPAGAGPPGRVHRPGLARPRTRLCEDWREPVRGLRAQWVARLSAASGTKVPPLRTRSHWAGRSGDGQDGIRHRPTTEGESCRST